MNLFLTSDEFDRIRALIYAKLGLSYEDEKIDFMNSRVSKRVKALQMATIEEYIFYLRFCDPEGVEMGELANLITTNETYMFREYEQLVSFSDHCLPELLEAKRKIGDRRIRVWSAGCSYGDEPYTLAIILREVLQDEGEWLPEVVGTDIDQACLERARTAIYDSRSVKNVPNNYMERHFVSTPQGFRVHSDTKKLVQIQYLNLSDRDAMRKMHGFDFIFCRNVLIYFDDASRKAVVNHFYNALNRGGYLFLGHAESVSRISAAFKLVRHDGHLTYRKD